MSLFVKNNTDKSSLLENEYKRSVHRLVSLLNLYNPVKYTPEVLKASKEDWIQEVKEAFLYSSDFVFELEEIYSQDERMDAIRADNEALENEVSKFILDINNKVLMLDSTTIASDQAKKMSKVKSGSGSESRSRSKRNLSRGVIKFSQAVRLESCRICKALDSIGDSRCLYEDHWSNLPIGCPRFMTTMTSSERKKIIKVAQICKFCFDPIFVRYPRSRHPKCPVFERSQKYTCNHPGCKENSLLCLKHEEENKHKLMSNATFWKKRNKTFIFTTHAGLKCLVCLRTSQNCVCSKEDGAGLSSKVTLPKLVKFVQ